VQPDLENDMHLTPQQLATRWHVSEKTLERWRTKGTGPAFLKVVGRVLYPLQHIEALETKRIRLATSNPLPADTDLGEVEQFMAGRGERS
jgi:hypothetical protein